MARKTNAIQSYSTSATGYMYSGSKAYYRDSNSNMIAISSVGDILKAVFNNNVSVFTDKINDLLDSFGSNNANIPSIYEDTDYGA